MLGLPTAHSRALHSKSVYLRLQHRDRLSIVLLSMVRVKAWLHYKTELNSTVQLSLMVNPGLRDRQHWSRGGLEFSFITHNS